MPGATNLAAFEPLDELLRHHAGRGGHIAAICAAPAVVLAPKGLLKDKNATCYPGFEENLKHYGAVHRDARVVTDGNIVTANGPSSAFPFALAIIEETLGKTVAEQIATGTLYK